MTTNKKHTKEYQDNLIRRYREEGDAKAKEELVLSNNKFIHKIARRVYKGVGAIVSYEDVYQESVVGFLVALEAYDLERGVKFLTYAYYQMLMHCNKAIYENMHAVRLPESSLKKKLLWSAGPLRKKLQSEGKEFTLENVAAELNVEPASLKETFDLLRSINYRISTPSENNGDEEEAASDATFYAMYNNSPFRSDDHSGPYMSTYLKELYALVDVFKERLNEREQEILDYKILEIAGSMTFQELGERWNISYQRVEQIHKKLERAFRLYCLNNIN